MATIVWNGGLAYLILKLVEAMVELRISQDEEVEGLDLTLRDKTGYNLEFGAQ